MGTLFSIIYFTLFLSSTWQATPGNRLLGVYIAGTDDSKRISFQRSFVRYIALSWPTLLLALWVTFLSTPTPTLSSAEREQWQAADAKIHRHETLNAEEAAAMSRIFTLTLSESDKARFNAIAAKIYTGQPLTPEEQQFYQQVQTATFTKNPIFSILLIIDGIYGIVIAFTIGLTREKTGLHDIICKTRAFRGRPQVHIPLAV